MSNSVSQNGKSLDQRLAGLDLSPSSAEERGKLLKDELKTSKAIKTEEFFYISPMG